MSIEVTCVAPMKNQTGEGVVWDARASCLWWVDIPVGLIYQLAYETGEINTYEWGEPVGCLAVRDSGGLVLATKSGFWFFDPATGAREAIHNPEPDLPQNRFNDGTTDPQGRFWAGTMPEGSFYRLDTDLSVTCWRGGYKTTNGLAFSPDGARMYFSDSHPSVRTIWVADYDAKTGQPAEPEVFLDTAALAGRPDGGTVDSEGCYWMAGVGGAQVYRFSPKGELLQTIDMPAEKPTKPMFGGNNLDTLFVTSIGGDSNMDGCLFAITGLGVTGLPQSRFFG